MNALGRIFSGIIETFMTLMGFLFLFTVIAALFFINPLIAIVVLLFLCVVRK